MSATEAFRARRDFLLENRTDYDAVLEQFSFPDVGSTWNWGIDWFDAFARGNPNRGLVILGDSETVTYSFDDLVTESDRVANYLSELGVTKSDPVIVMLNNQSELWITMLAVIKLGAVLLPTATAAGTDDLRDRVARSGAKAVIANAEDTEKFDLVEGASIRIATSAVEGWHDLRDAEKHESAPLPHPGTGPNDQLLLYFTSGTTTRPKLVEHTQASYPVGHLSTMFWLGLQPGDVHLNVSSPGWGKHAWSSFFAPWNAEATVVAYAYSRFDPSSFLERLREFDISSLCAPPTVWRMLIGRELGERPPALRELVGAGEPLNPEVIGRIEAAWGLSIRDGYGMTETTAQVGNPPGVPVKAGSMGKPLPGIPSVLVDVATGEVVRGEGEGELCLDLAGNTVTLMAGYVGDEEQTSSAMAGGFFHTGDIASRDADGYITYVGRMDDVFKASDYKISPFEVESILLQHPAVAESAVVPGPDSERLAVPKAYIALAESYEPGPEVAADIIAFAREQLAPWQRVRRVEFAELPKTISGKIKRAELRARELAPAVDRVEYREGDR